MENQLSSNTSEDKRVAYAYIRVSTDKQKKEGNSIPSQKEYAKAFANTLGINGKNLVFYEETQSASKVDEVEFEIASDIYNSLRNRPKLQEIVKAAQQGKFTDLILYSRDRLARNLEMFIALTYFFKKNKIQIHYSKPGERIDSGSERLSVFLELVLGSIAELEANLIGSRVKAGLKQRVISNKWAGGLECQHFVGHFL